MVRDLEGWGQVGGIPFLRCFSRHRAAGLFKDVINE